ncbi:MAG TPA: GspE/PulE family protein [Phycisphaerae bacterium]|nr:GspE/PulE family protein [Phycisphaerae bacterium]HNU46634.1 GspE/PulE family protein [Phycisphaerae bacterium]
MSSAACVSGAVVGAGTATDARPVEPVMVPVVRDLLEREALASEALETLVRYAAHQRAGDLYCTAQHDGCGLAMRCDGMLHQLGRVPKSWADRLIGVAKVEARLDATEHRRPQDGRIMVLDGPHPIDVRVSTMPTFFGEDLALRILDRRNRLFDLENLGLPRRARHVLDSIIHQPHGLILVSGSTGSGKTTTLYALLNHLHDGTRKINTIEDPVEFDLPGAHQSQVNLKIGLDFADLLPAVLRQDPDVIMVGEVRDPITATTTVRAAVTGQLVFATLHATRAAGAIHSMLGLGAHPHLLAGALRGVIAQHLLRRICQHCGEALDPTGVLPTFDDVRHLLEEGARPVLHQGRGCEACNRTGYREQIALFEILAATYAIRQLVERQATPDVIEEQARRDGMIPLRSWAKVAVANGVTTLEEAMRVIDMDI